MDLARRRPSGRHARRAARCPRTVRRRRGRRRLRWNPTRFARSSRKSWQRSLAKGVDPDLGGARPSVGGARDRPAARDAPAGTGACRSSAACSSTTPSTPVSSSRSPPRTARCCGSRATRRSAGKAEAMNFVPGADWSERSAGTNAPGTALALDRELQIRGSEHFSRIVQPWSCTAAPVHDPDSGALLGRHRPDRRPAGGVVADPGAGAGHRRRRREPSGAAAPDRDRAGTGHAANRTWSCSAATGRAG